MSPMKLSTAVLASILAFITFTTAAPSTITPTTVPSSLPFNFTYAFSATINLGKPPSTVTQNPITIPGGVVIPEPILNGSVTGPYINASITSGLAVPAIYNNQTLQVPTIDLYGTTMDGFPFHIHETGIGSPMAQVTRIELEIGGGAKYEVLRDGYLLAAVVPTQDRTAVNVKGYLVQNA